MQNVVQLAVTAAPAVTDCHAKFAYISQKKITSSKEINVEVHVSKQMKYLGSKNEVFQSRNLFRFLWGLLKLLNMNLLGYTNMKLIVQVT